MPTELHLLQASPTASAEEQLSQMLQLFRQLTKREPTREDQNRVRQTLGLPTLAE